MSGSTETYTCKDCQESGLHWGWNYHSARRVLLGTFGVHHCPTPNTKDVFPGWCDKCSAPELHWRRVQTGFELNESYGLPHACEQDYIVQDLKDTKCKYCSADELLWVKVDGKFNLKHTNGTKHSCAEYDPYMKDWAEAKRIDYAIEKAWTNSHPDGYTCQKCNGTGCIGFLSKNKRLLKKYNRSEPIQVYRPCKRCKRIGTFSPQKKKYHLKELRKKYWPYRIGIHKWKVHQ